MNYYKRNWGESRGDEFDHWGSSEWWLELDEEGYTLRNLQVYENGYELIYSEINLEDKYGMLPEGPMDLSEFEEFRIEKIEFDQRFSKANAINV